MFWEPQNSSLHHKGGEFLFPTVAESECTNYKQYVELQACMNKPGERVENCPLKGFASCQSLHEEILSAKLRGIEIDGEKNQSQVG